MLKSVIDKLMLLNGGSFDFLYLPIDFKNMCNVGYAFINMKSVLMVKMFYSKFNGQKWEHFKSGKICEVTYARLQGFKKMKSHFQSSEICKINDVKFKPLIL